MAVVVSRSAPYVEVSRINENVLSVFQDSGQGSVNLVEGIADGSSLVCHSDSQFVLRYFPGAFAVCTLCSHNLYRKLQLNHTGLITGLGPFGCLFLIQRQGHISAQSTGLRKICRDRKESLLSCCQLKILCAGSDSHAVHLYGPLEIIALKVSEVVAVMDLHGDLFLSHLF